MSVQGCLRCQWVAPVVFVGRLGSRQAFLLWWERALKACWGMSLNVGMQAHKVSQSQQSVSVLVRAAWANEAFKIYPL